MPYPPPPTPHGEQTLRLHDALDARIRQTGRPDLHPSSPTVAQDLLTSDAMVAWQEQKVAHTMLGDACWSELRPVYGRYGTDATAALITRLRQAYQVPAVVVTDCGASAAARVIDACVSPGAHVVLARQIYGKTRAYLEWLAPRVQARISLVDHVEPASLEATVTPETTLVLAETYSNPLTRALDPDAVSDAAQHLRATRAPHLRVAIDDTIATPWGPRESLLSRAGLDVVFGAGTKALGGQDRDLMGYVASHDLRLMNTVMDLQATGGGALSWRSAQALVDGLDEAAELFRRRCHNATELAAWLDAHPRVDEVFHPSLPHHPDAAVIARAWDLPGSLLSFRLVDATEEASRHLCDVLAMTRVVRYALSFDGLVTRVNHHQTVSEHSTPTPRLRRQGIDRLVRIGAGVEDAADLIQAFDWALNHHESLSPEEVQQWRDHRTEALGITPPGSTPSVTPSP